MPPEPRPFQIGGKVRLRRLKHKLFVVRAVTPGNYGIFIQPEGGVCEYVYSDEIDLDETITQQQKDRWKKLNFTIVGGPHHGMKIPPSHGHRVYSIEWEACEKLIVYRPHRFVVIQESLDITVFVPVLLNEGILHLFVNNWCDDWCDDEYMKDFDPLIGRFIHPQPQLKKVYVCSKP
jgi:hypothetical protein